MSSEDSPAKLWIIAFLITTWVLCGIGAAGTMFPFYQESYPELACKDRREDFAQNLLTGLMGGPAAAVVATFYSGFWEYGWSLNPNRPCGPKVSE